MAKRGLFIGLAIIILCLCCGTCFAAEGNNNSINLGNEIMESIDKTGNSINNVVSGNAVNDAGNGIRNGVNDAGNAVRNGVNNVKNGVENIGNDTRNIDDGVVNRSNAGGNYNAVRTTTEGTQGATTNFDAMSTTTWMWIILVVAAVIIIAAIWYYATQNNN